MFIKFNSDYIRLVGRWGEYDDCAVTANVGSKIIFSFSGKSAVLKFNIQNNSFPPSHIWIFSDGVMTETAIDKFLRVSFEKHSAHTVEIIYKSQVQEHNRWKKGLEQKICFEGIYVENPIKLNEDRRKSIEFVGDSITEGILVDAQFGENISDDRVYLNDSTATYAYLTAEKLNLQCIINGHGGQGVTRVGKGNVPIAFEAYPYNFENSAISFKSADYIVINFGANDRRVCGNEYKEYYSKLLDVVRQYNPNSKIFALAAFCQIHADALNELVKEYNYEKNEDIVFIDTFGWIPEEPLHPLREGHKKIAEQLSEKLIKYM